jgi:hypothetical protein
LNLVVVHFGIYLYVFQERLSGVRNGLQEGSIEATGKQFDSISGERQTCHNVVQTNLSDIELGGHLGGESLCSRCQYVITWSLGNSHHIWLLFIVHLLHRAKDVMLSAYFQISLSLQMYIMYRKESSLPNLTKSYNLTNILFDKNLEFDKNIFG